MSSSAYDVVEHRRRFAVWAAARAAQRGWESTTVLRDALERCGVVEVVGAGQRGWPKRRDDADEIQDEWRRRIRTALRRRKVAGAAYGRAAKLLAVYLKVTVVLGSGRESAFARLLHPPIDRNLLSRLARCESFPGEERRYWNSIRWTKLNRRQYGALIQSLRDHGLDDPAFWMIERFWQPEG
ncbi:MAG: hypothetical protein V3V06_06200 [Dehalococcoidia bacterium]